MIKKKNTCALIDKSNEPNLLEYDPMPSSSASQSLLCLSSVRISESDASKRDESDMDVAASNFSTDSAPSLSPNFSDNETENHFKVNSIHPELMKIDQNNVTLAVAVALFQHKKQSTVHEDKR